MQYQLQCIWCSDCAVTQSQTVLNFNISKFQHLVFRTLNSTFSKRKLTGKKKQHDKKHSPSYFWVPSFLFIFYSLKLLNFPNFTMWQCLLNHLPLHFLETDASLWHGRASKEMEFDEGALNEFTNIKKSVRGNQVSLTVKADSHLDHPWKLIV